MTADTPLACNLNALDPAARARHAEVSGRLLAAVLGIDERPDGYVLRLPASDEALLLAAEFIASERRCCPFFEFALTVGNDAARLSLTGAGDVKQFIEAEILSMKGGEPHV